MIERLPHGWALIECVDAGAAKPSGAVAGFGGGPRFDPRIGRALRRAETVCAKIRKMM